MAVFLALQHSGGIRLRLSSFTCLHYLVRWSTRAVPVAIYNSQTQSSDERVGIGNDLFYVLLKWVVRLNYWIFYIRIDDIIYYYYLCILEFHRNLKFCYRRVWALWTVFLDLQCSFTGPHYSVNISYIILLQVTF